MDRFIIIVLYVLALWYTWQGAAGIYRRHFNLQLLTLRGFQEIAVAGQKATFAAGFNLLTGIISLGLLLFRHTFGFSEDTLAVLILLVFPTALFTLHYFISR